MNDDPHKCPHCGQPCWRDEVDIGVGVQYGPWRCTECQWKEEDDDEKHFVRDFPDERDE